MPPVPNLGDEEQDRHFVHPRSDLLDDRTRVLKHGDTFAVFDRRGDAVPYRTSSHGLYHRGTRFLSRLELRLAERRPLLLGSTVRDDNALLTVDLANPDIQTGDAVIPADTIHVFRSRFVCDALCYERMRLTNHGTHPLRISASISVAADFADIFEVRGAVRPKRGSRLPSEVSGSELVLGYRGLDGVTRTTRIQCDPKPAVLSESGMQYAFELDPKEQAEIHLLIACSIGASRVTPSHVHHDQAFAAACRELQEIRSEGCEIRTSNELFNDWVARSVSDLLMMMTETEHGRYPYAGVPWFNTAFGRDGLITARESLWQNPSIAQGVVKALAATQATETVDSEDAEPGKIIHEMREGEMAALHEVPFGRYYGSIDSTPLFVMLARDYYDRTGDRATIEAIWPAISRALAWIDAYGDRDGDGFIEYARHSPDGLIQQGWKDSGDSVFYDDGRLVQPPVALCEVQGYVYAAREAGAKLALMLGESALAVRLTQQASDIKERFAERYWCEDLGMYALALDGQKQPCRVRSSNAGHTLFTGIAQPEHAEKIMATLMGESMFSGWGIRTLASSEVRYNPMSYHNGSIWPHDNALVASGMARYGKRQHALAVLEALFHASLFMDMHRMPELFCGFHKRTGQGPTLYPVACAPQAWAAASVFLLLEACLGLGIDGAARHIRFNQPAMPRVLDWIEIKNLSVGDASVDLLLRRARADVAIEVLDKRGQASITVTKTV